MATYSKTDWKDGTTPIDATNMNKIEDGIAQNAEDISSLNDDLANINILSTGTAIPSGADLNDYTTVGRYNADSASVAASLQNTPITANGFGLFVFCAGASSVRVQVAVRGQSNFSTSTASLIFIRTVTTTSMTWTPWYLISASQA